MPAPLVQGVGARPGLHRGAKIPAMQLGEPLEAGALRCSAEPADPLRGQRRHPRGLLRIVEVAGPQRRSRGQEEQPRAQIRVGQVGRRRGRASIVNSDARRFDDAEPRRVLGRLPPREDVGRQALDVGARRRLAERERRIERVLGTEDVRHLPRIRGIARGETLQHVGLARLEEGAYLCRDVARPRGAAGTVRTHGRRRAHEEQPEGEDRAQSSDCPPERSSSHVVSPTPTERGL